jgi:hypothetical protein
MSSFFLSRKAKKKEQLKKNKYQQMLYEIVRFRREEVALQVEEKQKHEAKTRLADAKNEDELVWSAKVGEVRNRLTGKKRASQDRWNRFAGTEGGGGRGL